MTTPEQRVLPVAEWIAEGERRFGPGKDNWMNWEFQCPCCDNIATPADFKALGADPTLAYQECIGRQMPRDKRASNLGSTAAENGAKAPCDYAAYGLLRALKSYLVQGESGPVPTIPFAEVPHAR